MQIITTSQYYDLFDSVVKVSESESVCIRRLADHTVVISLEDHITGTLTKLAYYSNGKWEGYNTVNFEKLFQLFRKHKKLNSHLSEFLTCYKTLPEVRQFKRVITCAKRRFTISIKSAHRSFKKHISL